MVTSLKILVTNVAQFSVTLATTWSQLQTLKGSQKKLATC